VTDTTARAFSLLPEYGICSHSNSPEFTSDFGLGGDANRGVASPFPNAKGAGCPASSRLDGIFGGLSRRFRFCRMTILESSPLAFIHFLQSFTLKTIRANSFLSS
jgi:hypothetical protein